MQKWEHDVLSEDADGGWKFESQGGEHEVGRGELEALNKLGADGWELAGAARVGRVDLPLPPTFYLKRALR